MKRLLILMSFGILSGCNNTATVENKADSLGKKVDSFSRKVWDSTKKEAKELKENIKDQFKSKDSEHK
jgi:hypothetical protein